MNSQDRSIVEEIRSYLGLDTHDRKDEQRLALGSEHIRSYIEDAYRLKAAKFPHHDAIVTAFTKTHHNMYLDDPAFSTTFKKEMTARGMAKPEIEDALDAVDSVLDKVFKEFGSKQEKDGGIHPKWDEIEEVSKPEQPDNGELITKNELKQPKANLESDLPINRGGTPKRQPPVMESVVQEGRGHKGTYDVRYDIELPQGDIYVEARLTFVAYELVRATYDSPEEGGEIEMQDFKITNIESDGVTITPEIQEFVRRDLADKIESGHFDEEIGEYLYEKHQSDEQDYYDHKRRSMREDY